MPGSVIAGRPQADMAISNSNGDTASTPRAFPSGARRGNLILEYRSPSSRLPRSLRSLAMRRFHLCVLCGPWRALRPLIQGRREHWEAQRSQSLLGIITRRPQADVAISGFGFPTFRQSTSSFLRDRNGWRKCRKCRSIFLPAGNPEKQTLFPGFRSSTSQ